MLLRNIVMLLGRIAGPLVAGVLMASPVAAQSALPARYWVVFRDKAGQRLEPAAYFSPQALARRQRQHLPPADSTDFPVRPDYLRQVRAATDSVTLVSRWFNAVACRATPAQAARLRQLPGVRQVAPWPEAPLPAAAATPAAAPAPRPLSAADRQLAQRQTASLGVAELHRAGLRGKGLRIAVFDVGFSGADRHPAFAHVYRCGGVVATYDFLRRSPLVYQGGDHGTKVLSCLAGRLPDDSTRLGLAQDAEFLLARTEHMHREKFAEEEAWLAAAEWADRHGADIINSSLGYTDRRYFPEQMNGRTSLVARAAEMAVRKGMLVVNAAGNDGDDPRWRTIGTPADGDSVLAVGGLDPATYLHIDFSSYGPAPGRRLKPNVAAFGEVVAAEPGGGFGRTQGTSFASPLVAGFAACVWQQHRQLTVMQLFERLQQSGLLYPYFDYAHGYGLPRASFFLHTLAPPPVPTFDITRQDSVLAVVIRPEAARQPAQALPLVAGAGPAVSGAGNAAQWTGPGAAAAAPETAPLPEAPAYVYWQVLDRAGRPRLYEVVEVQQRAVLQVPQGLLQPGEALRVHYRGYTQTYPAP